MSPRRIARLLVPTAASCLMGALVAAPVSAVTRRAFVTSVSGTGNIATWPGATGAAVLDKADSVCRALDSVGSVRRAP